MTLGRKKEDWRLNTPTLQQPTPSNVSIRGQLGPDDLTMATPVKTLLQERLCVL